MSVAAKHFDQVEGLRLSEGSDVQRDIVYVEIVDESRNPYAMIDISEEGDVCVYICPIALEFCFETTELIGLLEEARRIVVEKNKIGS